MKKYKIVLDRKMIIWHRNYYKHIEAESIEEAKRIVIDDLENDGVLDYYAEFLYDTATPITEEDNHALRMSESILEPVYQGVFADVIEVVDELSHEIIENK